MLAIVVYVCVAGAFGGLVNALLTSDTVVLPRRVSGSPSWQLGIVGNVLIGAAASGASWGLYGPFSVIPLIHLGPTAVTTPDVSFTVSAVTMAFLTGIGGTKWLNSEAQADLWQATAAKAAAAPPDPAKSAEILTSSAAEAYKLF